MSDDIYSGAAVVGKVRATFSLVFSCIVGICLLIAGIHLICIQNVHTEQITANVDVVSCTRLLMDYNYICNLVISYDYEGHHYSGKPLRTNDNEYTVNSKIDIYIDPTHPENYSVESLKSDRVMGCVVIGIAIFIVVISILFYWLTCKSKFFAATSGVGFGVEMMSGGRFGY